MLEHALQKRQGKSSGFAGTGLRGAHDVPALNHDRNGLLLDRGHGLVAYFGNGTHQRLGQLELGQGLGHINLLRLITAALQQKWRLQSAPDVP